MHHSTQPTVSPPTNGHPVATDDVPTAGLPPAGGADLTELAAQVEHVRAERTLRAELAAEWAEFGTEQDQQAEAAAAAQRRKDLRAEAAEAHRSRMAAAARDRKAADELAAVQQTARHRAAKATAERDRLTSPVGYLALLNRVRPLALLLALLPGVVGVVLGAGNVQAELVQIMSLGPDAFLYWALFTLEPLASIPLVALLLYDLTNPGRGGGLRAEFRDDFAAAKGLLLLATVVLQTVPHLLNAEPAQALLWLSVPLLMMMSLYLLPRLADRFATRLLDASTEAELSAPAGTLSSAEARLLRQAAHIMTVDAAGGIGGQRGEDGMPSAKKVAEALRGRDGCHSSVPAAQRTLDAYRLLTGTEPPAKETAGE